jgi:hypothetical protein
MLGFSWAVRLIQVLGHLRLRRELTKYWRFEEINLPSHRIQ